MVRALNLRDIHVYFLLPRCHHGSLSSAPKPVLIFGEAYQKVHRHLHRSLLDLFIFRLGLYEIQAVLGLPNQLLLLSNDSNFQHLNGSHCNGARDFPFPQERNEFQYQVADLDAILRVRFTLSHLWLAHLLYHEAVLPL